MARTPNPSSPTSRRKRAPGRPAGGRSEEPSAQRAQLLDAAIACFVRKGIAATSLRDIAQEAQVTPSLLHYYFGDKAQLQAALAEER
ncbi:MAG TPA: helix-turn-helix domain-containing protein, partial [Xanthomonadaceae bacterium]|nr:helix-turn-helix domain-containing protein [Xanthomonadaceae bacterium]